MDDDLNLAIFALKVTVGESEKARFSEDPVAYIDDYADLTHPQKQLVKMACGFADANGRRPSREEMERASQHITIILSKGYFPLERICTFTQLVTPMKIDITTGNPCPPPRDTEGKS